MEVRVLKILNTKGYISLKSVYDILKLPAEI